MLFLAPIFSPRTSLKCYKYNSSIALRYTFKNQKWLQSLYGNERKPEVAELVKLLK